MQKAFVRVTFLLGVVCLVSLSSGAQNPPASQRPAENNQSAQTPAAQPQAGMRRGPAPPVQGPPHDPHDLSGVWNARRGYGGDTYTGSNPEFTSWGADQFKKAKASNGGQYTLTETND